MKKEILLVLLLPGFLTLQLNGQNYQVSAIPDSLKEDAHSVIREYSETIELKSSDSGTDRVHKVITVLDSEGESDATLQLYYDKNSSVSVKEIVFYDSNGMKIKSVKTSMVQDYPAFASYELYSDDRIKFYQPKNAERPYTVEYSYQIDRSNIISLGRWMVVDGYNQSLQNGSLTLQYPSEIKINKKEVGLRGISSGNNGKTVTEVWTAANMKAIKAEPYNPGTIEAVPSVYLMPSDLQYDRYEGKSDTWEDYGRWVNKLYEGRDVIAPEESLQLAPVLAEITDPVKRIEYLYKYMQSGTRYIAVILGIGGYQPYDAKAVYRTGYGECKALSNYMHSLLKLAGIKSYLALVSAGNNRTPIFRDFPNFSQFNHVIVCVPIEKDTIWLECTDQKIPMGFIGGFTDDRDVLLLTENGGIFAHTKKYGMGDNLRTSKTEFVIDSTGAALLKTHTFYKGLRYDNLISFFRSPSDEQKQWLYNNSLLPSFKIQSFNSKEELGQNPGVSIDELATSGNYCSFSGNYVIMPLNMINVQKPTQKITKARKSEFWLGRGFIEHDTIVYKLPVRWTPESLPKGMTVQSKFGNYSFSIASDDHELIYIRNFDLRGGTYKPEDYKQFNDLIQSISKSDNTKILFLVKK